MNGLTHWDGLRHLRPGYGEWGSAHEMKRSLLVVLDMFINSLGAPAEVIRGYSIDDSDEPTELGHRFGLAAHVLFPTFNGDLFDIFLEADKFLFFSIGIYPDWKHKKKKVGGLHVDTYTGLQHPLRWIGIETTPDKYIYMPVTKENLRLHKII